MLISVLVSTAFAQTPVLTPEVQVRPRLELHTGRDGDSGNGDVGIFSQRTRLGASLNLEKVTVRAVVQDVRIWGEEANTLGDFNADNLDMHIATAAIAFNENTRLVVGRQEVAVHEHRLIGTVGWAQQARAFDGGLFNTKGEGWSADAGVFQTQSHVALGLPNDAVTGFLRAGLNPEGGQVDALYVLFNDGNVGPMFHTAGVYAKGKTGIVSGRVEGYGQFGEDRFAWLTGVSGTLAPDVAGSPKLTLWYDHLSGDSDASDGQTAAFNTMFATNHKFYGLMDVAWFQTGGHLDGQGLQDIALKVALSPSDTLTTKLDAHLFMASAPIDDAVLGEEVDLTFGYKATKGVGIGIGAAALIRPDLDPDFWSFVQLDAKL